VPKHVDLASWGRDNYQIFPCFALCDLCGVKQGRKWLIYFIQLDQCKPIFSITRISQNFDGGCHIIEDAIPYSVLTAPFRTDKPNDNQLPTLVATLSCQTIGDDQMVGFLGKVASPLQSTIQNHSKARTAPPQWGSVTLVSMEFLYVPIPRKESGSTTILSCS